MATVSSPSKARDKTNTEEEEGNEEEIDPLLTFHHVRTASVILPSGDRVRRKVSLMSITNESPFEEDDGLPQIGPGYAANTTYSSIASTVGSRGVQTREVSRYDKFKTLLQNEGLKRYHNANRDLLSVGC
jgi:hypothetical protein